MKRIEIIANRAVEENIMEKLADASVAKNYTKYPVVYGVGRSGPKMGDSIWPEENFAIVIWCDEAEAETISACIVAVKEKFPDEGIKLFML